MRSSSALLIRSLISKLHPPSPATARESQQLLHMLDGAFRKRLDELHPAPAPPTIPERIDGPSDGHHTASSHIDTVLHHPLLETRHIRSTDAIKESSAVALFEQLLRDGSLTLPTLQYCSRLYLNELKNSEKAQRTKLAPRIAAWMTTSTSEQRAQFFSTPDTIGCTMRVMYADGAEATVWDWLQMLYERAWGSHESAVLTWLKAEDLFVSHMLSAALQSRKPAAAAQQFVAANEYRLRSSRAEVRHDQPQSRLDYFPMKASWNRLAAFIFACRERDQISASLYDEVLRFAPSMAGKPLTYLSRGLIAMYHPSKPTAAILFDELHDEEYVPRWAKWKWRRSAKLQRALLTSVLDAAELSLAQQRTPEARFFLQFAQTHFPDIVSQSEEIVEPATKLDSAREELHHNRYHPGLRTLQHAPG